MKKVLVVGDTIQDHYVFGNIERVNPEFAGSLVLDYEFDKTTLGGAANVAANIKSLSKDYEVYYLGYISPAVSELLTKNRIKYLASMMLEDQDILNKTRYVYDNHIILRVDKNKDYKSFLNSEKYEDLKKRISLLGEDFDLIVVSDYAKKTLNEDLLELLFKLYNDKVFIFDIKKPINTKNLPSKCIFKCNKKEWEYFSKIGFYPFNSYFIRTEGKYGYSVTQDGEEFLAYPAIDVGEIVDVVGCGDTFLAGMAINYLEIGSFNPVEHAKFGNKCSAAKVKKFGTTVLNREDIDKLK